MSETAAPSLSLHQLSLYNTGRMTAEQVIAAFAARRQQFDRIMADLVAETAKSRAQHHLIVGQRGMGKTMLLARIAAELRSDPALSDRFIPLVFAEEQYAVDRLSKFWLNCLDSLADSRELIHDQAGVAEIDATVTRLTTPGARIAKEDQSFAAQVYEAFSRIVKTMGRRPVLLVDNLQLVFERLDTAQQHTLRELLMSTGSPILIGASPSPPAQSQDYGAPFYDHFKTHYLRPLDESEMRALLIHLAQAAGRDDVHQRVLQHPARLTVLRQLTGGNPRTVLTLFFLYAEDFSPTVFGDLEGLLDRVTPLYKARFEELTGQQQVVASAIANHWKPVTAAALAASTSLPAGTISGQLDRLEKLGVVERTELYGDTRTGYQLAERFFNIWFLMRSASRRQRREVEFLTLFLESFYEPEDRSRLARHLMSEERFSPDRYLWSRAVADSLTEPETAQELRRHAELSALREEAREARSLLRDLIDFNSLPRATLAFDELRKRLISLVPDDCGTAPEDFARTVLGDPDMFTNGERELLAARTNQLNQVSIGKVLESAHKTRYFLERIYSAEAFAWFSQRLATGQIRSLRDSEDWNRAFHQVTDAASIQLMLDKLPRTLAIDDASVDKIRSAHQLDGSTIEQRCTWARILSDRLGRYVEAEYIFREVITSAPHDPVPWRYLGDLLEELQRRPEAETAYREAIARNSKDSRSWIGLGWSVLMLNRAEEAMAAFREATVIDPKNPLAWHALAFVQSEFFQQYEEAEAAYREAIECDPTWAHLWSWLGNLYCYPLDRFSDAEEAFGNALRIDPSLQDVQHDLIFLQRDFLGEADAGRSRLAALQSLAEQKLPSTTFLQEALFATYDSNWGLAREALARALPTADEQFSSDIRMDWLRASAVLLHLNYGADLLALLDERGDAARLRPWVEALRAHQIGDRRALQNVAAEIRPTAEELFDGIQERLEKLPEATRRRPVPKAKKARSKRR